MSVYCSFKQVSPHLVPKIIEFPSVNQLLWNLIPYDIEEVCIFDEEDLAEYTRLHRKIDNIQELSSEYIQLLSEIFVEPEQAIGQVSLLELIQIQNWKVENLEDYQLIKSEIYQFLIEDKRPSYLDLKKIWDQMGYLFRGSEYSETQTFLVEEETNEEIRVEVIFGGRELHENSWIRYLESNEVREIAVALSKITAEVIRRRFEQGRDTQPKLYCYNWSEEDYQGILQICIEVIDFYIDAANQGKGILIDLC